MIGVEPMKTKFAFSRFAVQPHRQVNRADRTVNFGSSKGGCAPIFDSPFQFNVLQSAQEWTTPTRSRHGQSDQLRVPPAGFESATFGLKDRCSTTELRWHKNNITGFA